MAQSLISYQVVLLKEISHTLLAADNAKQVYANPEAIHQF